MSIWTDDFTISDIWEDKLDSDETWKKFFEVIIMGKAELYFHKEINDYVMSAGETKTLCTATDSYLMSVSVIVVDNEDYILRIKDDGETVLEISFSEINTKLKMTEQAGLNLPIQTYIDSNLNGYGLVISLLEPIHFDNITIEVENYNGTGTEKINYFIVGKKFEYR